MSTTGYSQWFRPSAGGGGGTSDEGAMVQLEDSYSPSGGGPRTLPFSGVQYYPYWDSDSYINAGSNEFSIGADGEYDLGFQVQLDGTSAAAVGSITVFAQSTDTFSQWHPQTTWVLPVTGSAWQLLGQANVPLMFASGTTIQFKWLSTITGVTNYLNGAFWVRKIGAYITPNLGG